jgi:hypothetical protein
MMPWIMSEEAARGRTTEVLDVIFYKSSTLFLGRITDRVGCQVRNPG